MTPDLDLIKMERLRREILIESRRFTLQIIAALAVAFAAGAMVGRGWR